MASLFSTGMVGPAEADPGELLGTVTLPGNGDCSVAGEFTGSFYLTMEGGSEASCAGSTLQIYEPPPGGNGAATLVATKTIVDGGGSAVDIGALAWDSSRTMVWGAYENAVWLIDIGDPTIGGDALATFQFNPNVGGITLIDGLAWDWSDDTLYHSPDVDCNVYQFSLPVGTLLNTVTPKNEDGEADCSVSGVAIGSENTLYIGRDGAAEIRRVDKTTGDFISEFATTTERVEDLTCDPVTYAPNETVLAKDAYTGLYEAFEVEPGTCPLPPPPPRPISCTITGTNGNDFIVGSDQRDIICARAGRDFVDGQGGNDDLYGQKDNDVLFGRAGNDRMIGNQGRDQLRGGPGRDQLLSHEDDQGGDFVDGGPDRDVCIVDRGDTAINCEILIVR